MRTNAGQRRDCRGPLIPTMSQSKGQFDSVRRDRLRGWVLAVGSFGALLLVLTGCPSTGQRSNTGPNSPSTAFPATTLKASAVPNVGPSTPITGPPPTRPTTTAVPNVGPSTPPTTRLGPPTSPFTGLDG